MSHPLGGGESTAQAPGPGGPVIAKPVSRLWKTMDRPLETP